MLVLWTFSCGPDLESVTNLKPGNTGPIVVFGDSITTGYGLSSDEAFPQMLQASIGFPILARGKNGDTTASALTRLQEDVLEDRPWMVIVELGGNDFLKNLPKGDTRKNLATIIRTIQDQGAVVVLLGMELGLFVDEYGDLYLEVSKETGAFLIPRVNREIMDKAALRQEDKIHPNRAGHAIIAERISKNIKPLLKEAEPIIPDNN